MRYSASSPSAEGGHFHTEASISTFAILAGLIGEAAAYVDSDIDAVRACLRRAAKLLQGVEPADSQRPEVEAGKPSTGLAPWQVLRVTRHIDLNLESCTRIGDLAAMVRLSPSHFSKSFRKSMGLSPHRYIISRRVEHAKALMLTTDQPLCEVSVACGLSDQAHLSRLFRRCTGATPDSWRRENRKDQNSGVARRSRGERLS